MDQNVSRSFAAEARRVIHLLVAGRYAQLKDQGLLPGGHTAADIRRILDDYGATLTELPDAAFATARVYAQAPQGWYCLVTRDLRAATLAEATRDATTLRPRGGTIILDLWTVEEERSGLSVELYVGIDARHPIQIHELRGFPPKLIPALQDVVHQLVIGNYAGLVADGRAGEFSAARLETVITEYRDRVIAHLPLAPGQEYALVDLSRDDFKQAHVFSAIDGEWEVDVRLRWSQEADGLSLRAFMYETPDGIRVEIEGLEVM